MAKATKFRELTHEALIAKVSELEAELFNTRLQATLGKLENSSGIQVTRREIARARTVLAEKGQRTA